VRQSGDIIALSPPLVLERSHIDQMYGTLAEALRNQR
jgi:beta-alanine--pyruvate transaminase